MIKAEDIRKTYETDAKLEEVVKKNTEDAKKCASKGECYCYVHTYDLPYSMKYVVLEKLKELGYREWPHTVYSGGYPQQGPFFTWI